MLVGVFLTRDLRKLACCRCCSEEQCACDLKKKKKKKGWSEVSLRCSTGPTCPVTVCDRNGIRFLLHVSTDCPPGRPDVLVMVASILSTAPLPARDVVLQAAVPKVKTAATSAMRPAATCGLVRLWMDMKMLIRRSAVCSANPWRWWKWDCSSPQEESWLPLIPSAPRLPLHRFCSLLIL